MVIARSPLISPAKGPVFCVIVTVYRPGWIFGSRHENPQRPPQPYSRSVAATCFPAESRIVMCGLTSVRGPAPPSFCEKRV